MKVAPLITVALIICIAFPCPIQAKKKPKPNKFCIGKDGNQYAVGQGYDDNDGKACVHYKCVKKKKKFVMKQGKCAVDGEWGDWSSWSDCSATCGSAIKKRTRTCSNPKPSNGGKPCHGQDKEVEECSLKACENTPTTPSIVAATSTALPIATTKPGATCTTPFQNILVVAKKGKKTYKFTCDFIMVYTNKAVVISKSSVWCKPPKGQKGLKVKVILKGDDELQFDAIVSIFPFAITAATVKGSKCNEEPTTKEPVTELPPGPVENVNVTALELNLQSLNDTVQSMLELISTMQSTANKQGTCLSDLSSSECPASAAGKVGVVDGIAANTANISTNTAGLAESKAGVATNQAGVATNQAGIVTNQAGIATNQAGIATNQAGVATNKEDITFNNDTCSSIQATATKLETCLSDVNSVDCPSSKGGKTSVPDAIIKNKDAVQTHHPDTTPTITPTSTTATTATSSTTTEDTTPTITPTSTTATTATSSTTTEVLWIAKYDKTLETLKLPDFTPVNASCKVPNPNMDLLYSNIQEIQGKLYSCDHRLCQTYSAEDNTWKTIPGKRFKFQRHWAAGTVIGDKWIIQGGWTEENGQWINVATAEVWSPGTGNWVEAPQYKSPLPVEGHCLVNINGKIMQIGGYSDALGAKTGKCFVDGGEVASLKAPRNYHSCAVFHGKVWVAGGYREDKDYDVEIYNPQSKSWAEGAKLPGEIKTDYNPLLVTYEGNLYYVGGEAISKIYKLNTNINQFKWEEVGDIAKGDKWGHIVNTKIC